MEVWLDNSKWFKNTLTKSETCDSQVARSVHKAEAEGAISSAYVQ